METKAEMGMMHGQAKEGMPNTVQPPEEVRKGVALMTP